MVFHPPKTLQTPGHWSMGHGSPSGCSPFKLPTREIRCLQIHSTSHGESLMLLALNRLGKCPLYNMNITQLLGIIGKYWEYVISNRYIILEILGIIGKYWEIIGNMSSPTDHFFR